MPLQDSAILTAIEEAVREGSRSAQGGAALGACQITVQGRLACRSGVSNADCLRAAKKVGGVARWEEGASCT
jgi:hypothetical protein